LENSITYIGLDVHKDSRFEQVRRTRDAELWTSPHDVGPVASMSKRSIRPSADLSVHGIVGLSSCTKATSWSRPSCGGRDEARIRQELLPLSGWDGWSRQERRRPEPPR